MAPGSLIRAGRAGHAAGWCRCRQALDLAGRAVECCWLLSVPFAAEPLESGSATATASPPISRPAVSTQTPAAKRRYDVTTICPPPSQRTLPGCSSNTSGGREWFNGESPGRGKCRHRDRRRGKQRSINSSATVTDGDNNTARVNGDNSVAIAGFGVPDPTGYFCAPTRTRTWDLRIKSP